MDETLETPALNENQQWTIVKKKLGGLMSNAEKQSKGVNHNRHSLGVDLGDSRTGVAITLKGYAPRPLSVSFCVSPHRILSGIGRKSFGCAASCES